MNKIIILGLLSIGYLLGPIFALATIDKNLYYGLAQDAQVKELQEFLIDKGFLTTSATGNFYSLTLSAVKEYQISKNIISTGYVGSLTRQAISGDLAVVSQEPVASPIVGSVAFSGLMNLSKNKAYSNQAAIAPQVNFKLADFILTNKTTEVINLNKIQVDLAIGTNLDISNLYINNLYIVYKENKTSVLASVSHNNYWTIDYKLPVGETINLSVYGDVNSSMQLGSTINVSLLASGISAISAKAVSTNSGVVLSGQVTNFRTGSFEVAKDGSTPESKIYVANQKIVAGKYKFTTIADSYTISQLKFIIPGLNNFSVISSAVLLDATTQDILATVPIKSNFNENFSTFDFDVNISVQANSSKSLIISYNLGQVGSSGTVNINIAPVLIYIKTSNSNGTLFDGAAGNYSNIVTARYKGISMPSAGVTVNSVNVYKSVPIFTFVSGNSTASNDSEADIYKLNIKADENGDISIKQLTFEVTIKTPNKGTPSLNKLTFYKGDTNYTSSVAIGNLLNGYYAEVESSGALGIGIKNTVVVFFENEEIIPAGKNQTYTLKAHTTRFVNTSALGADSIVTSMPSDKTILKSNNYLGIIHHGAYYGLKQTRLENSVLSYNLLWSDKSASSHSADGNYSSNDWYNGFGVLNLPLTSQTVKAK